MRFPFFLKKSLNKWITFSVLFYTPVCNKICIFLLSINRCIGYTKDGIRIDIDNLSWNIWIVHYKHIVVQLDLTSSMEATKLSNLAPVTSFTILPCLRILKVGTTFMPSSFANGCQNKKFNYRHETINQSI